MITNPTLNQALTLTAIFALSLVSSLIISRLMIRLASKIQCVDVPNHRSSHTLPTPRGGGISFIISFLIGFTGLYAIGVVDTSSFAALTTGGMLVALGGYWDDVKGLAAKWRLCLQVAGVALALLLFGSGWLFGIAIIAWVWLINLYNFMDGIDGLATTEAIVIPFAAAIQLSLLAPTSPWLFPCLLLGVAVAGFYPFNRTPAKIFMGDAGSGFLGFILGGIAVATITANLLTLTSWLILLAVFWVDTTWTLLYRFFTGQAWYRPHCSHSYQRLAKKWNNHLATTFSLMAINVFWLLPLSTLSLLYPTYSIIILLVAVCPLIALCFWLGAGRDHRN